MPAAFFTTTSSNRALMNATQFPPLCTTESNTTEVGQGTISIDCAALNALATHSDCWFRSNEELRHGDRVRRTFSKILIIQTRSLELQEHAKLQCCIWAANGAVHRYNLSLAPMSTQEIVWTIRPQASCYRHICLWIFDNHVS